jgi:hypothetical protein
MTAAGPDAQRTYPSLVAQDDKPGRSLSESLQIIVTVPVLLDLLLCHSRAGLPREESRSFPTPPAEFGIPRARQTRARE